MVSPNYGLVSGRVSSLALDPSDATGNTLYVGTTGGGVWRAQNAATATSSPILFNPLTDAVNSLSNAVDASISIGALTVQPGGTGVILAGTGDPNDALDSYYGAGILRSADGGATWTLIPRTADVQTGTGAQNYSFQGEGFAGFAWSTLNPQLVVGAVSQSIEGQLVDAEIDRASYKGLYYSSDSGATWHLARITDGSSDVQGPLDGYALGNGSAATSVVWNPVRGIFLAAVRFHGYYQSADGRTWTRLPSQPGPGLTTVLCPTNPMMAGSPACPIFRGVLAVNPLTGDTFAWTVDENNQDQGLWQDACSVSGGKCGGDITFGKQWSTTKLETDQPNQGAATIANGDYNLTLAAVPSQQDTMLLAGGNDLWQCSLAMGCAWRNTTNSTTCMSAQVGEYQHAIEWNTSNPLEVFVGNDSGLWRSLDAVGETGSVCAASDASHWQNLNGSLGSLAEVESMSAVGATPYTMMAGLGANGTAGVKGTTGATQNWPQILSGEGGPVVIDPTNANNWYVNNGAGVSIHLCSKSGACTPADFEAAPAVSNANVADDGLTMTSPAPFLVDPQDSTQLLIGTCRLWRGPASGAGWSAANAVVGMLDGNVSTASCGGDALIRSMAAMALPGGGEVVYVGVYGLTDGGATLAGHVLSATMNANGSWSAWTDLTLNPVLNDPYPMNFYELDVSSVTLDPHDATGNTVYVTVAGFQDTSRSLAVVYRSMDGGAHWNVIDANLTWAPANALAVDPADANTVYVATDAGVFSTRSVASCGASGGVCWAAYGTGLPMAPVVALSASPAGASPSVLVAGTYGRGLWQIPLLTSTTSLTTANVSPASLTFGPQTVGTSSSAQTVTVSNTGTAALMPGAVSITGDFSETDNCAQATIAAGANCSLNVTYSPTQSGSGAGQLTIAANVQGGSIAVTLGGTGLSTGSVALSPSRVDFGPVPVGTNSSALSVTMTNSGATAVPITSLNVSGPFALTSNSCGTVSLAANTDCVLLVEFQPSTSGAATGMLTMVDGGGTQVVQLTGSGTSPPTDTLSAPALSFPSTVLGNTSAASTLTITNSGMNPLTSIQVTVSGPFVQSNNCSTQLAAESRCAISVQFLPTAPGVQTGTLTVKDILSTQSVVLSGTGQLPPGFSVSPPRLTFAAQQAGVASAPITLTLTNSGAAAMADVGLQITGPAATSFSFSPANCGTLDTGANCKVQVVFTPTSLGVQVGTLTVTSNSLGVIATVPLSGTGFDFSAATAGAGSQTVASGQTANYAVTLTPLGGIAGAFTFQCSALPTYAACLFNPATNNVAANATGTETVQITTSQATGLVAPTRPWGWQGTVVLACGLLLVPVATKKRRRRLAFVVLLLLAIAGVSSCSSSGGGGGGTPTPTPTSHTVSPGTYSVSLVVTSGSVQHTITLTLVVD